jgi:S-phase kinase-associated protein 1
MSAEDTITLTTSDEQSRIVEEDVMRMSGTIKDLLDDVGSDKPIPLINIDSETLDQLIVYMKRHVQHPEDHLDYKDEMNSISEWDLDFCAKLPNELLFKIILAANYLDINPLLQLTCKTVAKKIKGKSEDEIREELKFEVEK